MTALAGYWAFGRGEEPVATCERMLDAQKAYGTQAPSIWAHGNLAVGKRLFPTLDEDAFDTGPVVSRSGRWVLVADMRLDERDELAAALGVDPREAHGLSDSALAMVAVERWGEEAIERLYGDFALALWDRERARLWLARDIAGLRPLHVHCGSGFLAFASMPSGIHTLEHGPSGADERALGLFLAMAGSEGQRSFFRGIERIRPGETRIFASGGTSSSHLWTAPGERRLPRGEDYVEAAREAFERAVKARLRGAGGKVAAHLSGGLDSGGVAATAARQLTSLGRVTGFTSVPGETSLSRRGRFVDEGPHAAAVAALYPNMEHVLVRTTGRSPVATLDRNFALYQSPVLNLCSYVWGEAINDEAQRRGHRVLLIGQMGNFTLSHPGLERLPQMLARGQLGRLLQEAAALRRRGVALESVASSILRPFLPNAVWAAINRLRGRRIALSSVSALNPTLMKQLEDSGLLEPVASSASERRAAMFGGIDTGNFRHGALAGWSLDVRDPTADRRLIELCLSIPADQYFAAGWSRALARRVLADRLPQAVVEETRKGFQGADWHQGVLTGWDILRSEVASLRGLPAADRLLDLPRLHRLLESESGIDWDSNGAQADYRFALLRAVSAGHFLRRADDPTNRAGSAAAVASGPGCP